MNNINLLWLAPAGSILALVFSLYLAINILRKDEGNETMKRIAAAVMAGAKAFLKRQYTTISIFFAVAFVVLFILMKRGYLPGPVPFAFLTGGFFSALCGYLGMIIATRASSRTACASMKSLNSGLRVAFSSGAVMGLMVVGMGLLYLSLGYYFLNWLYRTMPLIERINMITGVMLCFGMGASSVALFARVGGGIFTKAADVGADLVGKVEAGIPEDDPRNPAVIADNVGDNVGDVAGMGADLYESYVGAIIATMALGAAAFGKLGLSFQSITIPMVIAAVGIIASILGTFLVRSGEEADQGMLLGALRRGIFFSAGLILVASFFVVRFTLGMEYIGIFGAVAAGLIAGIIIGLSTEFFTSARYSPTRFIADQSRTGPATVIIGGIAIGMSSTAIPVLVVGGAILASYFLTGGARDPNLGLYGIGISAVGMLSTLGITLASDAYGPVADNAGGNAEMSKLGKEVRQRTDALDALGNTTAATGKGFAIGSAALTALALIAAFHDKIIGLGVKPDLTLLNPKVVVGLFIGGMLPFFFCAMTMRAVGRAAGEIVKEVRRQFKEIKGLIEGSALPDYASCVDISTRAAQKEMIFPALMAVIAPIALGLLAGIEANVGLLVGATVTGFVMAMFLSNAGGAWDNAKKFIEEGAHGGKGSFSHKAAVVGDTVGDPCKDTSGPSINILIKLMSMVSIVFASFIIANSLTSCSSAPPLYKETQVLMGTIVEVTIEHPKGMHPKGAREKARDISRRLFHRIKELEKKFSLYNPESEITLVNKNAWREKIKVSPEFFELLEKSLVYSELTYGAFDISVAPLVRLWGFKEHKPKIPKAEEIKDVLKRCGYTCIILSAKEHEVSFSKPGIEIDMGAIAKGYIVDEGVKFLKKEGIDTALINAGGDLCCIGSPSGKEGWSVAIRHPRKEGKNITQLNISDKAVATSGDYENFFLYEDKYLSHIIDTRTGWPSETGVVSATVISPRNFEADALATALIVMDKKKGLALINHLDKVEAIIISLEEGKLNPIVSSGLEGKLKFEL